MHSMSKKKIRIPSQNQYDNKLMSLPACHSLEKKKNLALDKIYQATCTYRTV